MKAPIQPDMAVLMWVQPTGRHGAMQVRAREGKLLGDVLAERVRQVAPSATAEELETARAWIEDPARNVGDILPLINAGGHVGYVVAV